ncbi:MAG: cyclase family protein [Bacteriovoracaceae bacterium]
MNLDKNPIQIIDISPLISKDLGVFPGDKTFERHTNLSFESGHNLELSSIETTLHLGAHTDAPNHYHSEGMGIHERSLHYYLGDCQVVEIKTASGENNRIIPSDFDGDSIKSPRVLFKTNSFPDPDNWNSDFYSFAPETIELLASKHVITVGIDTPSVDPENDKDLLTHNQIFKFNLAIIEGIVLKDVDPGHYFLSALPLKIKDADAAPCRAVLIKEVGHAEAFQSAKLDR